MKVKFYQIKKPLKWLVVFLGGSLAAIGGQWAGLIKVSADAIVQVVDAVPVPDTDVPEAPAKDTDAKEVHAE